MKVITFEFIPIGAVKGYATVFKDQVVGVLSYNTGNKANYCIQINNYQYELTKEEHDRLLALISD